MNSKGENIGLKRVISYGGDIAALPPGNQPLLPEPYRLKPFLSDIFPFFP
jgi:hypothetical protein